jgi:cysteine desulfurase/selenocysteine lyase
VIYLDNASTSWPKPEEVYRAVDDCLRNLAGSPGRGGHGAARAAAFLVYEAREALTALFGGGNAGNLMFVHNATDAINTALLGLIGPGDAVVASSMEHNAVARPLRALEARGASLRVVGCDKAGRLPLADLKAALSGGAKAVVVCHGSNVSGTLAPLAEIGALARAAGALFVVDAAQTAGREDIDVDAMSIDVLAFSGHKSLFGPQGTGGLYVREGLAIQPLRYGGTGSLSESDRQPDFYPDCLESGTHNTPGLAGLLAGVRYIKSCGLAAIRRRENELTQALLTGLAVIPGLTVYGPPAGEPRAAVVSFTLAGRDSGAVAQQLDREFGIACRAGLHCAPWAHCTLGTLASGTVRLSPGYFTTDGEIAAAIEAVRAVAQNGKE